MKGQESSIVNMDKKIMKLQEKNNNNYAKLAIPKIIAKPLSPKAFIVSASELLSPKAFIAEGFLSPKAFIAIVPFVFLLCRRRKRKQTYRKKFCKWNRKCIPET